MENKRQHLEMIQRIIDRMAGNLFYLRGWGITLIAAFLALAAKDENTKYIIAALFPITIFWILDGYFLSQERQFRCLYDEVRKRSDLDIDFSMNTSKYNKGRNTWIRCMVAPTLLWFYGPLIAGMVVIIRLINL